MEDADSDADQLKGNEQAGQAAEGLKNMGGIGGGVGSGVGDIGSNMKGDRKSVV